MKLSTIIQNYRIDQGLSQRKFAEICGLSNSYISFIENEKNPKTGKPMIPTIEQYKKIADGIGISVHSLFEMLDEDAPVALSSSSLRDLKLSQEEKELIELYRGAEDTAREIALEALRNHQKQDTAVKAIS